jgi:hypothetical protein
MNTKKLRTVIKFLEYFYELELLLIADGETLVVRCPTQPQVRNTSDDLGYEHGTAWMDLYFAPKEDKNRSKSCAIAAVGYLEVVR